MRVKTVGKAATVTKRFLIAPKLPYAIRAVLVVGLITAGFYLQLVNGDFFSGISLIFAGALMGALRSIKTKPELGDCASEWIEVTPEQWNQADKLIKKCKRWKTDITNVTSWPGATLLAITIGLCCFLFGLTIDIDYELTLVFIADTVVLFLPLLLIGSLIAWEPPTLKTKLKALNNVLESFNALEDPGLMMQPMMEITKGAKASVPADARLMIRMRDAPQNFYGVQVQVSINTVQSNQYAYLYAVITCAQDFPLDMKRVEMPQEDWLVIEPSVENDVVVIVIRQRTTKTSGYHTDKARQNQIVDVAVRMARDILRTSGDQ